MNTASRNRNLFLLVPSSLVLRPSLSFFLRLSYPSKYGAFDGLAAAAVRKQKETYPHIELILVLAYLYRDIDASRYDSTTYPPLETVPPRYAIVKRNEWMVSESSVVISGVTHSWGSAAKTLEFAQRKKKVIFQYPTQVGKE